MEYLSFPDHCLLIYFTPLQDYFTHFEPSQFKLVGQKQKISEGNHLAVCRQNIRIFNGCEMQIENSVTRVTVRHHEACQVRAEQLSQVTEFSMRTSQPLYGFFFLHTLPLTIAFRLEVVLFYQFYPEIHVTTFFSQEMFSSLPV